MRKTTNNRKLATLAVAIVALASLAATSCTKEKKCRCTYDDTSDPTYVYVDPTFSCSKVTQLGYDVMGDIRIREVTCTRVKKNDLDSDYR
ncbi:MAG: hypothetical protein IJU81_01445 [Bacteroidales bacterium]|nr:hypothetical protein [Bacteroidales bacterium]